MAETTNDNISQDRQSLSGSAVERLIMPLNLKPMKEAPKDGTEIVIFWDNSGDDFSPLGVRVGWWSVPKTKANWDAGARPKWEYINDRNFAMSINKPLGWLPIDGRKVV